MEFTLTKEQEERIRLAQQRTQNSIFSIIKNQHEQHEKYLDSLKPKKATFWDGVLVVPTMAGGVARGFVNSFSDVIVGIGTAFVHLANDVVHIFDSTDGRKWHEDTGYALMNFVANVMEPTSVFITTAFANAGRVFQASGNMFGDFFKAFDNEFMQSWGDKTKEISDFFDPKWATGEGGAVEHISDVFKSGRAIAAGENPGQYTLKEPKFFDQRMTDQERKEANITIDEQIYIPTENIIRNTYFVKQKTQEFTNELISALTFHSDKRTSEMFGEKNWYNMLVGTSESIGNIMAMWAMSGLAQMAVPNASQATLETVAKTVGTTYFASSVFGKSYAEALDQGAGLNDAYIYAMGNALSEVALENLGGFKTGETSKQVFDKIKDSSIVAMVKNMGEEAMEEIIQEYGGAGFNYYIGQSMEQSDADFYSDVFWSGMGGALASVGLGAVANVRYNMTVNKHISDFHDYYKMNVSEFGKESTLKSVNKTIDKIVKNFNKDTTTGYTQNEAGGTVLVKMDNKAKVKFINNSGLSPFIKQIDGKFIAVPITENSFDNTIYGKKVDNSEYAINKFVVASDLTDNGNIMPMRRSELNEFGKKAMEFADKVGIPIVIYDGKIEDSGYIGGNNNIYINQKHLNAKNIETTIAIHEAVHGIKKSNPEAYEKVKKEVNNLYDVEIDRKGVVRFLYKSTNLQQVFQEFGIEQLIMENINEYAKELGYDRDGILKEIERLNKFVDEVLNNPDASKESILESHEAEKRSNELSKELEQKRKTIENLAKEESVAYFIDQLFTSSEIIHMLVENNLELAEELSKTIDENSFAYKVEDGNQEVADIINDIRNEFEDAITEYKKYSGSFASVASRLLYQDYINEAFADFSDLADQIHPAHMENLHKAVKDYYQISPEEISLSDNFNDYQNFDNLQKDLLSVEEHYSKSIKEKSINDNMVEKYNAVNKALEKVMNEAGKIARGKTVLMKRKSANSKSKLTPAELEKLSNKIGKDLVDNFMIQDKDGNYILNNDKISNYITPVSSVVFKTYDGKTFEYDTRLHAISIKNNFNTEILMNVPGYPEISPVEFKDMSNAEFAMFKILEATPLNFVMFRQNNKRFGYTIYDNHPGAVKSNVSFLNINNITQKSIGVTILHENIHKVIDYQKADSIKLARDMRALLAHKTIDSDGNPIYTPTKVWEEFDKLYTSSNLTRSGKDQSGFFNHFNRSYYKDGFGGVVKLHDFYTLMHLLDIMDVNTNMNSRGWLTYSEFMAHFLGEMFSTNSFFSELYKGDYKDFSNKIFLSDMYDRIMNDASIPQAEKIILENTFKDFRKVFDNYINDINKQFPLFGTETAYKLADINAFVKNFTDGQFTTKNNLLEQYRIEKMQKKRGDAHITLDNIIYVASKLAETASGVETIYNQLSTELETFKKTVGELVMDQKSAVLTNSIAKTHRQIVLHGNKLFLETQNLNKTNINKFSKLITEQYDKYSRMSDTMLESLGLPNKNDLFNDLNTILKQIDNMMDFVEQGGIEKIGFVNYNQLGSDFHNMFKKFKKDNSIFWNYTKQLKKLGVKGNIVNLHKESRNQIITNLRNAINKAVSGVNTRVYGYSRAKIGGQNADYNAVYDTIALIDEAIKVNAEDYGMLKTELKPLFEKLNKIIMESEYIGQYEKTMNATGFYDVDAIEAIKSSLINENLRMVYEQFGLLFNDINFATDIYQDYYDFSDISINDVVKGGLKINRIATNLAKILNSFANVYNTSFNPNQNTDAYASDTVKGILKIQKEGKSYDFKGMSGWKAEAMTSYQIINVYAESTAGEINFFKDFKKAYMRAHHIRELILADYDRMFKKFTKTHPGAVKNSNQLIEIDGSLLVFASEIQIEQLKADIAKRKKEYRQKVVEQKAIVNSIKADIRAEKAEAKKNKHDPRITMLEQNLVKEQRKLLEMQDMTDFFGDSDFIIRQNLINKYEQNIKDGNPTMIQRGELVSLYMSLQRELEMWKMYEAGESNIQPTKHFVNGNAITFLDSTMAELKGLKYAKENTRKVLINEKGLSKFLAKIEGYMNESDFKAVEFAKQTFDMIYRYSNVEHRLMYNTDLDYQSWYIPFTTAESDILRSMKHNITARNNISMNKSFIMKTQLGANQSLMIENIFALADRYSRNAANLPFQRVLTDYQNLLVNKIDGVSLQTIFSDNTSIFGKAHGIHANIEGMFGNIMGYQSIYQNGLERFFNTTLQNVSKAIIGLNPTMYLKQHVSLLAIAMKNNVNLATMIKEYAKSTNHNNKYHQWLLANNPHFYNRVNKGFLAILADYQTPEMYGHKQYLMNNILKGMDKASSIAMKHVSRADAQVLVAAFRTKIIDIMNKNPNMSETQAMARASEWISNEVMTTGIAHTSPAIRSRLSNSKSTLGKVASRFQGEVFVHYSAIVANRAIRRNVKNKITLNKMRRDDLTFALTSLVAAIFSNIWGRIMGYDKDLTTTQKGLDFIFNDWIWQGMVSSIPYIGQFTSMFRYDFQKNQIGQGFDPQVPMFSEAIAIGNAIKRIGKSGGLNGRNIYRLLKEITHALGLPIKNLERLSKAVANVALEMGADQMRGFDRVVNNKTKTTAYYEAVKYGRKKEIEAYIDEVFDNQRVKNEISTLQKNNKGSRIMIYGEETFRSLGDNGKYITHKIPEETLNKYRTLTDRAIAKLIRTAGYRKLSDKDKIASIQRIINYYYNYMKKEILSKKRLGEKPPKIEHITKVAERSLNYAQR